MLTALKGWQARSTSAPRKRRLVTPLVMQMHMTECGAACLGSILGHFGRWVPLSEVRDRCSVSRDGSTAAGLVQAAGTYGLKCKVRSLNPNHLVTMPMPQVLFWEWNHFLILEGFEKQRAFLNDPATGRRVISMQEFGKGFSGIALHFTPGNGFRPGGTPPGLFHLAPSWFKNTGITLAFIMICGLMLALLSLTVPFALGVFTATLFDNTSNWGMAASGALALAAFLVFFLGWIKQQCLVRLTVLTSITAGNRYMSRLLRLKEEFFRHRLAGDLTERILSIDKISRGLQSQFIELLIDFAMSMVFLVALLAIDLQLAFIILGLALVNGLVARTIERLRSEENQTLRREQNMLISVGMLMLQNTENLRITATDDGLFSRWSGHQARELASRQRFTEAGIASTAIPGLFLILTHAVILGLGATRVINDELTLGGLVAVYVLAGMFLAPIGRFAEFVDGWQSLSIGLQRLEDITDAQEDDRFIRRAASTAVTPTLNGRLRLSGQLELRDVTFGYDRQRDPLIKNLSLIIEPGQRVAVVGTSGSGKSTLVSLISGNYKPWFGDILFNGLPREEIPDEVMVRSIAAVDQQPILFSATIRDNITLWNPTVPDDILVAAARDACIHDTILERPLGYSTQIVEDGSNFSGGERQRLELARALVGNPTLLLLDEATSALDTGTEKLVDDALRRRGASCLVVAHRLSTIRDCDKIYVLDSGIVVQCGTHDEILQDRAGLYARLFQTGTG